MTLEQLKKKGIGDIIRYRGEEAIKAVRKHGYNLKYIHEQNKELCMEAVKQDGDNLKYVHKQDREICIEAVRQNGNALQFVHEQDRELCMEAVKQCGYALQFVDERVFKDEMTMREMCQELGRKIKIIKQFTF